MKLESRIARLERTASIGTEAANLRVTIQRDDETPERAEARHHAWSVDDGPTGRLVTFLRIESRHYCAMVTRRSTSPQSIDQRQ